VIRAVVLFLALATVAAQVALAAAAALWVGARGSPAGARLAAAARREVAPSALALAWLVSALATAGSLFFSEVAGFVACRLCWYQRAAMYPLVVLLGVAAWRGAVGVRRYAWPLAGAGLLVAIYHYLVERFPSLERGACDPRAPCTVSWVWQLGYISIPMMAASAFALIAVLLALARRLESVRDGDAPGPR
jgi:disulfide bond formation protein DsbB